MRTMVVLAVMIAATACAADGIDELDPLEAEWLGAYRGERDESQARCGEAPHGFTSFTSTIEIVEMDGRLVLDWRCPIPIEPIDAYGAQIPSHHCDLGNGDAASYWGDLWWDPGIGPDGARLYMRLYETRSVSGACTEWMTSFYDGQRL